MPKTYIEPTVFLEHEGVTVFHTYKDGNYDSGIREYWFTTDINEDPDNEFDIRKLSAYDVSEDFSSIISKAIDKKEVYTI